MEADSLCMSSLIVLLSLPLMTSIAHFFASTPSLKLAFLAMVRVYGKRGPVFANEGLFWKIPCSGST